MSNNYITDKIGDLIEFNPTESLPAGSLAKKIAMEKLTVGQRKIDGYEYGVFSSGAKFRNGDTLLAKITPCLENGKTAQVDILDEAEVAFGSTEFIVLRETEKIDKDYLFYLARSPHFRQLAISCMEGTSGRKRVSESSLQLRDISIPKYKEEQQKIANVLSSLDKKIETNNKIIKELESMVKELYDYWFVQFDFPDSNGKPYRKNGGKMTYIPTLKREIPDGWKGSLIKNWIESEKGGDWGNDDESGNYSLKVSCIRGADINGVNGNGTINAPLRFINKNNTDKLLSNGDVIIEISGGSPTQSTGRAALVTDAVIERFEDPIICSNFCKAVTLKDLTFRYNFIYEWQRVYDSGCLFGFEGKTSGIKNFLYDVFIKSFYVATPPKSLRENFIVIIEPINQKKHKLLNENQELATLRDWLLPMLMNGQIAVSTDSNNEVKENSKAKVIDLVKNEDRRFELWLQNQRLAARGDIDKTTLREIFDTMDDDDKS